MRDWAAALLDYLQNAEIAKFRDTSADGGSLDAKAAGNLHPGKTIRIWGAKEVVDSPLL